MFREASKEPDNRFIGCCKKVLKELTERKIKVDRIILVGGSSRLFHVPEMVENVFGIKPLRDTDPDLAIVKGAIVRAESIFGNGEKQLNLDGHMYLAADIKAQTVAAHAICIAARKTADSNDQEEYNVEIVPANTSLPYEFQERFAPVNPSQRSVVVKIIQGKAGELSSKSTLLRKIEVPIDPSEKDTDRILVKGRYTEEGLLEITVIDEIRGEPFSESFIHSAGLSNAEIERKIEQLKA